MKYVFEFLFKSLIYVFGVVMFTFIGLWDWDFSDLKNISNGYIGYCKKLFTRKKITNGKAK
jgi:hypothetical protein